MLENCTVRDEEFREQTVARTTWSFSTVNIFESSEVPIGGIEADLQLSTYDLFSCI